MEILSSRALYALAAFITMMACVTCAAAGNDEAVLERRLKAAFISKFAAFVDWPPGAFSDAASPIVIGVAGGEELAEEIEQAVAGRAVSERAMRVRRLVPGEPIGNCCHIAVVGRGIDRARASELLSSAQGKPILTVTEDDRAGQPGSVINLFRVDGRVRFDISRHAADRNGLHLSSQLLGVAREVRPASQ